MLSIFTIDESKKWDEIVVSFKQHDVYYLSSYVKAFCLRGEGEPYMIYFDNGTTRAINVVMKRDIARCEHFDGIVRPNTWYDLSTPYGYGGFLVEGEDVDQLNLAFTEHCQQNNIVSEFVRFHPLIENASSLSRMYEISEIGKTVHIDLISPDYIWGNFTSKNRNAIRKARKLGVEVYWGRSGQLISQFMDLYNRTMDGLGACPYYYFESDFYDSILCDLRYNSMVFFATHDDRIIAMSIILFCNGQMHYHLSGSDWDYRTYAATNLMLYEAALWGHTVGFKTFHLGGGLESKEDSLYKFKKAFNRTCSNTYAIGRRCFNMEVYNWLVEIRMKNEDFDPASSFFPLYRSGS